MNRTYAQNVWLGVLLLLAALVPSVCVLWFMNQAVRNEHLAVRQRLTEIYGQRLEDARARVEAYWQSKIQALNPQSHAKIETQPAIQHSPGMVFAQLINADVADSVVMYDAAGHIIYPNNIRPLSNEAEEESLEWRHARELEHELSRPAEAATAYAAIANQVSDTNIAARAWLAQARCLARAGEAAAAIDILMTKLADEKFHNAVDEQGRSIQCNSLMLTLQLLKDPTRADFRAAAETLIKRVADYSDPLLSSGQRLFLMQELRAIVPDGPTFPTLDAEVLAADYFANNPPLPEASRLTLIPRGDAWCLASQDRTIVAFFNKPHADSAMQSLIDAAVSLSDVVVTFQTATAPLTSNAPAPFIAVPAGTYLPDWQLALYLKDSDPFAAAARRQVATYAWTAGAVVVVIALLALLLAQLVTRQMKLSRMKNDLVATVSHELKTPLSSMRLLVDTLLDGKQHNEKRVREYLQLIARENARLSRLIDNFLTFSRMERNKQVFTFAEVRPEEIVSGAVDAAAERLNGPGCRFEVVTAPNLPVMLADADAVVTVLLNLLDNAYKYSGIDKQIILRTYAQNGNLLFDVQDNGTGLSQRAARKVFKPFYQVDQRLSRSTGGCGLGLSIVQYIVSAHGGSVHVISQPDHGSTFTITLPAIPFAGETR